MVENRRHPGVDSASVRGGGVMSSRHEEKKAVSAAGGTSKAAPGLARHGATKRPSTSGEAKWAEPKSTRPVVRDSKDDSAAGAAGAAGAMESKSAGSDMREPKDDSPAGAVMKAVPAKRRN